MREDVVLVELGKICNYSKGKKPKVLTKEYSEETPYPYINIKAFEHGIFDEYTDGSKCNLCEDGDLLMVWDGARAGFTGKAKKGAIGSTLMKVEPKKGIEKNYLFYFLLSLYKKLNTNPRGVGIPHVEPNLLWTSELIIPSLPEQRAIVQKIESYFALLDKGIADLKTAQEQLKTYRQAVLKKAFEGEYTMEWRKKNKWSIFTFEEITESLKRGPFGGDLKKEYFVENGYAVYEQQHAINNDFTNIRYFINEERYNLLKACIANPGDYIVSCSGTIGKIARIPEGAPKGVINQALLRIRINEKTITHKYFIEFFRSHIFQKMILRDSRGSGMQNMAGVKEIKSIKINLPSIEEQQVIVREIESRLSVCDKVEQSISEALEKAEALRQSILKKAFEGGILSEAEITACKQEPDYESASVLLERIKKEEKHGK